MLRRGVLFLVAIILVSGCGTPLYNSYTNISEIKANPQNYQDRPILIKGRVTETVSIPFVQKGMYELSDDTGTIWVLSQDTVPFRGDRVSVRGRVKTGFTIASRTFGTILAEEKEEK